MSVRVIAFDTMMERLLVFPDEAAVIARIEGIEFTERGWLIFAEDGAPMEPVFSIEARVFPESDTYRAGEYTLRRGGGQTLPQFLMKLVADKGSVHLWSFEQMQGYFAPGDSQAPA